MTFKLFKPNENVIITNDIEIVCNFNIPLDSYVFQTEDSAWYKCANIDSVNCWVFVEEYDVPKEYRMMALLL